ncbi:MAG: hypothetical protein LUD27_04360, partial [Clostridia bacterium]|nr:hypothetical protein [Clostridia bacterium]
MRRKHDDDDESIFDILMRPASMDYDCDGKIDYYDCYIELDKLDRALGQGKYSPYNDPYYIEQQEEEDAKIYGKDSAYYDEDLDGDSDFDEEAFMNEVPRVTPLVDDESDDDEDDAYDDEDEIMDDLYDSYEQHNDTPSERTITLSFSFESQSEKERKKFPTTGIWQYFDNDMEWKFTQALYTYDKSLKESCGTKYDGSDEVEYLLRDIYQFDRKRAIDDWGWLLKTFPAGVLNSAKVSYGYAHSFRLSMRVFTLMFSRHDDYSELAQFISRDEVFEYLTTQAQWPEHDTIYLYELVVCCHKCGDELFKKCYKTVIDKQRHCFCDKDLADVWNSVVISLEWKNVSESLKTYIKEEIVKVGDFGKPVLKTIEEKEEESEEERRQEEEERRWKEEERLEAEREAAEAEERRLEKERLEAERKEREQQIKILEEMSAPLSTKIIGGELFDEAYMAVNQQLEYCFGSSRKTYDTVARYVLGKNGKIRDINKDLQVGVISSKDIKTIFML